VLTHLKKKARTKRTASRLSGVDIYCNFEIRHIIIQFLMYEALTGKSIVVLYTSPMQSLEQRIQESYRQYSKPMKALLSSVQHYVILIESNRDYRIGLKYSDSKNSTIFCWDTWIDTHSPKFDDLRPTLTVNLEILKSLKMRFHPAATYSPSSCRE
jgi:hypothetical protein